MRLFAFIVLLIALLVLLANAGRVDATRGHDQEEKVTVCHCDEVECDAFEYEPRKAYYHLKKHENDYKGICIAPTELPSATPTLTPTASPTATPTLVPTIVPVVNVTTTQNVTIPAGPPAAGRGL